VQSFVVFSRRQGALATATYLTTLKVDSASIAISDRRENDQWGGPGNHEGQAAQAAQPHRQETQARCGVSRPELLGARQQRQRGWARFFFPQVGTKFGGIHEWQTCSPRFSSNFYLNTKLCKDYQNIIQHRLHCGSILFYINFIRNVNDDNFFRAGDTILSLIKIASTITNYLFFLQVIRLIVDKHFQSSKQIVATQIK
jgi:hypothetical protein